MIDIAELKRLVTWIEAKGDNAPMGLLIDCLFFVRDNAKGIIEEIESLRMQLALAKEDHASDISIMRSIQSNHVTTAELELYKENARLREAAKGILAELDETGPGCADTVCPVWSVKLREALGE